MGFRAQIATSSGVLGLMSSCDIAGCDKKAVAEILLLPNDKASRCPECLEFDGRENGWW